jgi:hypothetical protein
MQKCIRQEIVGSERHCKKGSAWLIIYVIDQTKIQGVVLLHSHTGTAKAGFTL